MREVALRFIQWVASFVPGGARREFRDEWRAELTCHWSAVEQRGRPGWRDGLTLAARAAGAVPDALCLVRQEWSLDMLMQDLRYAVRTLSRRYGFTALVVLTLALGVGANTAVFSVIDGVLLRPLPYHQADRLMMVWEDDRLNSRPRYPVAPGNFTDWREQSRAFEALAAFTGTTADLTGVGEPVRIGAAVVWPNMFDVLGVSPVLGRGFTPDDGKAGNHRVAILSHGSWQSRFNADPNIVGRELRLNGNPFQVIGVMPRGFVFPEAEVEVWRPMVLGPDVAALRAQHFLSVVGRLAPRVTTDLAQQDMDAIARRAQLAHPETNDRRGVTLVPLREQVVGDVRRALYVIGAAVGMVLLIGCANVANLLLAAGTGRVRELAVRTALGASRARIVRQLLVEAMVLASLGGAAGLALAIWGTRLLASVGTAWLPRAEQVSVDARVFAFAAAMSLLTGLLFALLPAIQASRGDVQHVLKDGARGAGPGRTARRIGSALIVGELALAVVLVIGAGLVLKSFWKLNQVNAGFNASHVLTAGVNLPASRYDEDDKTMAFYRTLFDRLASLPGVRAAGAVNALPMNGPGPTAWLTMEGQPRPTGEPPEVGLRSAQQDYFKAMEIPVVRGRGVSDDDTRQRPRVVVINQALVDRFYAGRDPLGTRIRLGPNPNAPWWTIVGVVGSVRHNGLEVEAAPEVYRPLWQSGDSAVVLTIRTDGDPNALAGAVRGVVQSIDANLPLSRVSSMEGVMAESTARRRLTMLLLGAFATLALVLAVVGIYGVLAYAVSQRRQEIGVRMAVGARGRDVVRMVVREGMALGVTGLAIGLLAALAANRLVRALLFDVTPTDAVTYGAVSAIVLTVAALAAYVPARRASRVDPLTALRE